MPMQIDVLIPTCNRPCALAVTLAGLAAQDLPDFRVVISDQSDPPGALERPEVQAVVRLLKHRGHEIESHVHLPRRGMAEQRAFLLSRVTAPWCLFLDDDVLMETNLLRRMLDSIRAAGCGFVGSALHGLSFAADVRPHQQAIEFWDGPVTPEVVEPHGAAWQRDHLHSAANLLHVQQQMEADAANPGTTRLYKVAWVGGCVLYDTAALRAVGGFDFWQSLPPAHCGEDVLAQLRVMQYMGGCAIFPSGAYHMELPTTVSSRQVDAPRVLPIRPSRIIAADPGSGLVTLP